MVTSSVMFTYDTSPFTTTNYDHSEKSYSSNYYMNAHIPYSRNLHLLNACLVIWNNQLLGSSKGPKYVTENPKNG
jgi:hypothetical protein